MNYSQIIIPSPIGELIAVASPTHLMMLEFADSPWLEGKLSSFAKELSRSDWGFDSDIKSPLPPFTKGVSENPIIQKTILELSEYFAWTRKNFDIPLAPKGTDFQKSAWQALEKIPYGETRSYKEEAILASNSRAVRAIGGANNKNPIVIIIPCHRVIGADGSLVGYGWGIKRKIWLIEHEKKIN